MKKWMVFVIALVFLLGLAGCSDETAVWEWTNALQQADISTVTPWHHDGEFAEPEPLNDARTAELVALLNSLTKQQFTENKKLVGITPTFGITLQVGQETCRINYAPSPYGQYGTLEISFREKLYWIDSPELDAFLQTVTGGNPGE